MRMRKKPNLGPRMERCSSLLVPAPAENLGRWSESFPGFSRLELELGCGKGRFTADTAGANPEALLVAVERVPDAMVVAMERCFEAGLQNVRFIDGDAGRLEEMFAPGEVSRIYINFPDPWPKKKQFKRRLTAPSFLRAYCRLLPAGGEIQFKTDNVPLFDWSEEQLSAEGWELFDVTRDLHKNGPAGIMTDYEAKFYSQGLPICRLRAVKTAGTRAAEPVEDDRCG